MPENDPALCERCSAPLEKKYFFQALIQSTGELRTFTICRNCLDRLDAKAEQMGMATRRIYGPRNT